MNITFNPERKLFRIFSDETEYAFAVNADGRLVNLHWGAPMATDGDYDALLANYPFMSPWGNCYSHSEYRHGEPFDYATPCLRVRFADGAETVRLRYMSHETSENCLKVTLSDEFYPLEVTLVYKTYDNLPLISKSAVIKNLGKEEITLLSALSASVNLPTGRNYRLTHYSGGHLMEYGKNQTMLTESRVEIATNYLTSAASHRLPFFALDEEGHSDETKGEVYFGLLRYSGDFRIAVETLHKLNFKNVTVSAGINDMTSQIPLGGDEAFETPDLTIGFSQRGFEHMSEILYDWQFDYTLPNGSTDKAHSVRPVIYNTWYPYEFSIDEEKLVSFIPRAKRIGAELFVIDDGWMKGRVDDKHGLGDWVLDEARFPHGLGYIADRVHGAGMKFGLWVEPEMTNPDSDFYRAHPDRVLSELNRHRTLHRTQLILDMSRDEIRDYTIDWLDALITEAKLDYLKWDMNREVSELELYAYERGVSYKYMKNIEAIWKHLSEKFPDLLLENCASGGGRADFGMARFADRVNRSDNADPIDVMLLHEGYSTFFVPKLAGGAGNVSPEINHVNLRRAPLDFRVNIGMTGSMSVGVNLLKCDDGQLDELADAVSRFKEIRSGLQDAYVYRIASAFEHPYLVLEYLKRDRSEFTLFAFGHGMHHSDKQLPFFRMRGLTEDAVYECGNIKMSGRALMSLGVQIQLQGDYSSKVMTFRRVR